MAAAELSVPQEVAATTETEFAIRSICVGLSEFVKLGAAHNAPEVALQFLAQGFERLTKLILILGTLEQEGWLMSKKDLQNKKKAGHRVDQLLSRVIELCETTGFAEGSPAMVDDLDFLKNDARLSMLVEVIADFGDSGRYNSLDILVGESPNGGPREAFEDLKFDVLADYPEWEAKLASPEFNQFYEVLYGDLMEVLQHFARSLCRMFSLGLLGQPGKRMTAIVQPFIKLRDQDLRPRAAGCGG